MPRWTAVRAPSSGRVLHARPLGGAVSIVVSPDEGRFGLPTDQEKAEVLESLAHSYLMERGPSLPGAWR